MKLISINSLKVGEKLGSPIRLQDGRVLLPANATVTAVYLARLKSFGILSVYIEDERFDDIELRTCITDETKTQALNAVASVFKQLSAKKPINATAIKRATKDVVSDIKSSMSEPIGMFNQYAVSDSRCIHAVNVACMVAALAIEDGCNYAAIEEYTQAALMHDIMLNDMSEDAGIEHAWQGRDFLKASMDFSTRMYMSVAAHHERYDGTGGPRRLKNKEIPDGARMLAVADLYDNLVYGYGGHKKYSLHHAVEYLNMESGKMLDPTMLNYFNRIIAIYPTGATVRLNNGLPAVVTGQNPQMPARPKVRLAMDSPEECLQFNLITQNTIFIDEIEL